MTRRKKEYEEWKKTVEKVQKESQVGSNENMVKLQMCFEQAQTAIIAVKTALAAVEGSGEIRANMQVAIKRNVKRKGGRNMKVRELYDRLEQLIRDGCEDYHVIISNEFDEQILYDVDIREEDEEIVLY